MQSPAFLRRWKDRLEAPERGAATMTVTLRDLLLVTHAVPAERARPFVPENLPLDMLPGPDGERLAFLQVVCAYWDNLRWSPLAGAGLGFHQCAYRILTRHDKRRGAFVLRTVVGTPEGHALQRTVARETDYAPFTVHVADDPATGAYDRYTLRAVGERGQTAMDVRGTTDPPPIAAPFALRDDLTDFLTRREDTFYAASAGGIVRAPTAHAPLQPVFGELVAARLSLWTEHELLAPDDLLRPLAVLMQPALSLTLYPPRRARFADFNVPGR